MAVSYKKLWKLLIDLDMKKERLTTSYRSEFCTNSKVRSQ